MVVVLPAASVVLIVVRVVPLLFTRVSTEVDAVPLVRVLPFVVVVVVAVPRVVVAVPEVRVVVAVPEVRVLPVLVVVVLALEVRLLPVVVAGLGSVLVLAFALAAARSCPALRIVTALPDEAERFTRCSND